MLFTWKWYRSSHLTLWQQINKPIYQKVELFLSNNWFWFTSQLINNCDLPLCCSRSVRLSSTSRPFSSSWRSLQEFCRIPCTQNPSQVCQQSLFFIAVLHLPAVIWPLILWRCFWWKCKFSVIHCSVWCAVSLQLSSLSPACFECILYTVNNTEKSHSSVKKEAPPITTSVKLPFETHYTSRAI